MDHGPGRLFLGGFCILIPQPIWVCPAISLPLAPLVCRDVRSATLRAATNARCSRCLLITPYSETYRYAPS